MDHHDLDYGPVRLVAGDGPLQFHPLDTVGVPMPHSQAFASNRAALLRASELSSAGNLFTPVIIDAETKFTIFNSFEISHLMPRVTAAPTHDIAVR